MNVHKTIYSGGSMRRGGLMMSEVRLVVCEACGKHGRFLYANGGMSAEFNGKPEALAVLQSEVDRGVIDWIDFNQLHTEVLVSTLPDDNTILPTIPLDTTPLLVFSLVTIIMSPEALFEVAMSN